MPVRTRIFLPLLAGLLALPLVASAGVRVWDKDADDPDHEMFLEIGGFVQPGLLAHFRDAPQPGQTEGLIEQYAEYSDTGFYLQRARINLKLQLSKYFTATLELETVPVAALQDAYLESRIRPWLVLRAGQFLVPFLQTFQFSEANLAFIDREIYVPQANDRPFLTYLSPRDIGFSVSGLVGDVSRGATKPVFEYALGVFNGAGVDQVSSALGTLEYTMRLQLHLLGVPEGKQMESDLVRNATPHIAIGGGLYSNCDTNDEWNRGFTADAEFRYGGFYSSASFVWIYTGSATGRSAGEALGYTNCHPGGARPPEYIGDGAHWQAQYLLPRSVHLAGGSIEFLGRFDWVNPFVGTTSFLGNTTPGTPGYIPPVSFDDTNQSPSRWRITAGVNWFPLALQTLRLSVNYQLVQQTEPLVLPSGQTYELQPQLIWIQATVGI